MKLDRLIGILTILLQRDRVTAPWLARRFEVSRRTIGRDIDALCQAGIPVITHPGGGGGISVAEGFKVDKSLLTQEELATLTAAIKGLGSVSDADRTLGVLDKLGGDAVISLRESVMIDLASHYKGSLTAKIELLRQGIRDSRLVEFDYYYEKGEAHRRVEPCFVIFKWTAWYLFCYCTDRQDWRLFKLTRLWNLKLCAEGFHPRDIPPEKLDLDSRFSDDVYLLSALFQPSERYRLIDVHGPSCYTVEPDGRLRLQVGYTSREHLITWLLGFGDKVTVLEPEEIAREIKEIAKKVGALYE